MKVRNKFLIGGALIFAIITAFSIQELQEKTVFFYTSEETLTFDVHPNNSESITISGERKYDHNALIADSQSSVLISGPILKDNEIYDFNIELRTIYDPSNWIFSLNNFNVQVTP